MSMTVLWLSSIAKILFVLIIAVGVFAPVLIWAERRQSAMMQDRVGPTKAAIVLPPSVVALLDAARGPLSLGALLVGVAAGAGVLGIAWTVFAGAPPVAFVSVPVLVQVTVILLVLYLLLRVGHAVHTMLVKNNGHIMLIGLLHPLADAVKFIWKEDFIPPKADKLLHALAPIISLIPAIAALAVLPFADVLFLEHVTEVVPRAGVADATIIPMQVADLNVGILFIFAIAGTGVVGAAIGGYASDSKYSLLGGMRAASQMVSYEVALGLTLVPCFMVYGSLRLADMAVWQADHVWGVFVLPTLPLAFILFMFAAIAETKRVPFDLPEGESELAGGYLTEYSGMKFGMFFMGEFVEVVVLAALAALIFLGGWDIPYLYRDGFQFPFSGSYVIPGLGWTLTSSLPLAHGIVIALQVGAMLLKIVALIWFQLMIRWTLPRFRYDQVMHLCWKGLLPLALFNILLTGALINLGWLDGYIVALLEKVL